MDSRGTDSGLAGAAAGEAFPWVALIDLLEGSWLVDLSLGCADLRDGCPNSVERRGLVNAGDMKVEPLVVRFRLLSTSLVRVRLRADAASTFVEELSSTTGPVFSGSRDNGGSRSFLSLGRSWKKTP